VYRLRVESGCRQGDSIPLAEDADAPLLLGRGYQAGIRFPTDATMSRIHAELRREDGQWVLYNRSRHTTVVGRKRVDGRRSLQPGDRLVLGDTQVVFELESGAAEPAHPLTPATPTIARAPDAAGYDADGKFHMGQTLLGPGPETSFVWLAGRPDVAGSPSGPIGFKIKRRRLYFLLVVTILGLAGCLSTGLLIVLPTLLEHPGTLAAAAAFALLPAIPWLLLIKLLDRNDQIPWQNYLSCLVWGGAVGCGFALVLNTIGGGVLAAMGLSPGAAQGLTATIVAPVVEEIVKGMGVLVIFWILHDEFDNVLEGLVLGAASGLGFALIENVVYDVNFLERFGVEGLLTLGTYRSLVNALLGHPVYTAMFGAGLGLLRETPRHRAARYLYPLVGLGLAIGLHVLWNTASVYLGGLLDRQVGEVMALVVHTVVFGGAGLLFFVAAYWFAANRERRVLVTYLGEEVDKGFIEPEELASFHRLLGRQRYELAGFLNGGTRVYRARRALRRAQVELAFRKWHLAKGDAPRGGLVDKYIHDARSRIRDARNLLNDLEARPLGQATTSQAAALAKADPPTGAYTPSAPGLGDSDVTPAPQLLPDEETDEPAGPR